MESMAQPLIEQPEWQLLARHSSFGCCPQVIALATDHGKIFAYPVHMSRLPTILLVPSNAIYQEKHVTLATVTVVPP